MEWKGSSCSFKPLCAGNFAFGCRPTLSRPCTGWKIADVLLAPRRRLSSDSRRYHTESALRTAAGNCFLLVSSVPGRLGVCHLVLPLAAAALVACATFCYRRSCWLSHFPALPAPTVLSILFLQAHSVAVARVAVCLALGADFAVGLNFGAISLVLRRECFARITPGLEIAPNRSYLHTLGPKVGIMYVLGALGLLSGSM